MRELINDFGHKIADSFTEDSYCRFAPPEETLGYIDTSVKRGGKQGIAFLCDEIVVSHKSSAQRAQYRNIKKVTIGGSVNPYEDELFIEATTGTIHITNDYINKLFLKQLIDNLCRTYNFMTERQREDMYSECTSRAMSHFTEEVTEPQKPVKVVRVAAKVKTIKSVTKPSAEPKEQPKPTVIDEKESVTWSLSHEASEPLPDVPAPIIAPIEPKAAPAEPLPQPETLSDKENIEVTWSLSREKTAEKTGNIDLLPNDDIEGMTKAQTMNYLLESISEINNDDDDELFTEPASAPVAEPSVSIESSVTEAEPPTAEPPHEETHVKTEPSISSIAAPVADVIPAQQPAPEPILPVQPATSIESPAPIEATSIPSPYTVEPEGSDIYLIASRKIREMYENGSLAPELVEHELKANLIFTAEEYTRISEAAEELPPYVATRAPMLQDATDRLADYFAMGEDIGTRVMLFMMFQMLSYSDRIEESEETKQRLNEFFKRCGSAGVVLSMLDSNI